jgi:hypothetical protein
MANKHSRQGLALGVSLALGATTLGVLPAQAVDYENLSLTIAEDDTNGVLATTMTNDFELELEWDVANVSDLAYLKYEVTVDSSEDGDSDVYGVVSGLSWDSAEDDIDADYPYDWFEDGIAEDGDDYIIAAPAHVIGDDEVATYRVTTTRYWENGDICDLSSTTYNYNINSVPNDSSSAAGCDSVGDAGVGVQTVEYRYESGYTGALDEPAPVDFESLIWLTVASEDTYVDLVVEAWLDKDGDDVRDATESYAAPVTIRFWNDYELTPALDVSSPVWVEDLGDTAYATSMVYITQELNEYYTEDLSAANSDFAIYSDLNYDSTRDGYVYLDGVNDGEDVNDLAFDSDTLNGKHIFANYEMWVDSGEVSRIGVADFSSTETDTYFDSIVHEIVAGPTKVTFVERTVDYIEGLLVEQPLAFRGYDRDDPWDDANFESGDGYIHESVEEVTYIITMYNTDGEDDATVSGVDAVVTGYTAVDESYGDVTVNGVTVPMTGEDAGVFEVEATSNAAGQLVLEIAVQNPDEDFYVQMTYVDYQGITEDYPDYYDEDDAWLDWQASDWYIYDELNLANYIHANVGDSIELNYDVRDQWFQVPAANSARVLVEFWGDSLGGDRDYEGAFGDTANVVNGRASFTVPDVNPDAGEGSVYAEAYLYVKDAVGGWPISEDYTDYVELDIDYLDDAVVASIDMDEDSDSSYISYGDFTEINVNLERMDETTYDAQMMVWDEDNYGYFDGYVRSADGHALAGQKVVISSTGLWMYDALDYEIYDVDSLTLFTNEDGYFEFYAYGHTVGDHTITISSGGKSATATFEVTNDNVRAHDVTITSPFAAQARTADTLTALVTDRYGNVAPGKAVTFSKVSGSGYIEAPATSDTDEDGVASATLVVLGGEVGFNSTVRAAIEQETFAAASNSEAAQRSAGDTNVGKTTAWTKLQDDGTAKMYAKNIVGVGKVQFFHNGREIAWVRAADALNPKLRAANGAFYLVRTVELVDGKNVLEVYIDGERVRRTAYTQR